MLTDADVLPGAKPRGMDGILTAIAPAGPDPDPAGWRAWRREAGELALWADDNLINRRDVYGGYWRDLKNAKVNPTTRHTSGDPDNPDRRIAPPLDRSLLRTHFDGTGDLTDIVGLHVADGSGYSRWGLIDIDVHDDSDDPEAAARMAARVVAGLSSMGLPFRLEESNGKGGYHAWVLFGRPIPMAVAHRLGKYLIREWADCGLPRPPESFPKSPCHAAKKIGNWVRLPGPHHKRDHWSCVWSTAESRWLRGREAVESLLAFVGDPSVAVESLVPSDFAPGRVIVTPPGRPARAERPASASFAAPVAGEPEELARARSALAALPAHYADEYETWRNTGMALKALGDGGLDLWDEWAMTSPFYSGYDDHAARWASFAEGDEAPDRITPGWLVHHAVEAGWEGRYTVLPAPGIRTRRRSNVHAHPEVMTPSMSEAWDRDFERHVEALADRPLERRRLAERLLLTPAQLGVVEAAIGGFGLKPTNRGRRADGTTGPLGMAWTWRELDGKRRTVGLRRLFAEEGSAEPELGPGPRLSRLPGAPARIGRIARRGLLINLSPGNRPPSSVYLTFGLLDFAALAARRWATVALPSGPTTPRAALADLRGLLAVEPRPLLVPYREGPADSWAGASSLVAPLGRELGEGLQVGPYPRKYTAIHEWLHDTDKAPQGPRA